MSPTPGSAFSHWASLSANLLRSADQLAGWTRTPDPRPGSDGRFTQTPAMMTKNILTLTQVAEYLKVHKLTIYRLVRRKKLRASKIWHDWRFDLDLIDQWRFAQEQRGQRRRYAISVSHEHGSRVAPRF